ncbi:MAG: type II toxin-antitoxin system RnlA family toxin [Clostridiales bacterium]|nr:type II toxin-antitoxin system RnlA family toxin [Clostridiales bacterium]
MDSVRINYNKCSDAIFASFIKNINISNAFKFRAHNPADATVLQDRYTFTKNNQRISIVYETKAQTLIITAPGDVINDVAALIPSEIKSEPNNKVDTDKGDNENVRKGEDRVFVREQKSGDNIKPTPQKQDNSKNVKAQNRRPKTEQPNKVSEKQSAPQSQENIQKTEPPQKTKNPAKNNKVEKPVSAKEDNSPQKEQSDIQKARSKKSKLNSDGIKSAESLKAANPVNKAVSQTQAKKQGKADKTEAKKQDKTLMPEVKAPTNTFTIKRVTEDRFNELLKKIKANKNMRYKLTSSNSGVKVYSVTSQGEKATLKYAEGNIQLGGNRGDLYSELQLMMSQVSDYKTAIKSHIQFSGEEKRAQDIERQLKKQLPNAFEFLSEQSKIDLAIGIIDINNSAVVLSDYSTLLIPCFRGLERLIFDLQHAQGIVVKMIGQAYEKEEGSYVLKSGYRRKIPSVIYAEVMASLYTEYFKQRNFYAHSDGGYDNISRVISDKQQVQAIFNHIMNVINYNGKKLKEIGFRIK